MRHKANIPVIPLSEEEQQAAHFVMTEDVGPFVMNEDAQNPHRHPFYEILYVKETDGVHFVDFTSFDNIENKMFLLCPGQVHYWEATTSISGMLIYFREEFLFESSFSVNAVWELNLLKEMSGQGIDLAEGDRVEFERLLNMMYAEFKREDAEYASILRAYLNVMLIRLFRIYKSNQPGGRPRVYSTLCEDFRRLVLHHAVERQPVHYYAEQLNVSMGYLNEQVKRQMGLTPGEVIRMTMVTEAKRLIANTDLSMSEIAEMLGFRDGSYFCRLFKKEMGISPIRFRQSCVSNNKNRFMSARRKEE